MSEWFYNEFRQTGLDFESEDEVAVYDQKLKTRNIDQEIVYISKALGISPDHYVLEIGAGTCELSIGLSKLCSKVYAADISTTMLKYSGKKAAKSGINNIEFLHTGFLGIAFESFFDIVISQIALHHLPDFWKRVALKKIFCALKPGGKFFLRDCILSFNPEDYAGFMDNYIANIREKVGDRMAREMIINIRDEFPAFFWVIEKMLRDSGFDVNFSDKHDGYFATFICTKPLAAE